MVSKDNEQFGLGRIPADQTPEMRLTRQASHLPDVLKELNALIETGVIRDYAIGGGYAVIYHGVPYTTFDLDVFVVLGREEDYHKLYDYYRQRGNKEEHEYIIISNMAVQFFPNFISPLFDTAIKESKRTNVSGIPTKVISIEYLIALLLDAFRPKDKIHISELIKDVDMDVLNEIVRRFNDERNQLSKKLKEVLGKS